MQAEQIKIQPDQPPQEKKQIEAVETARKNVEFAERQFSTLAWALEIALSNPQLLGKEYFTTFSAKLAKLKQTVEAASQDFTNTATQFSRPSKEVVPDIIHSQQQGFTQTSTFETISTPAPTFETASTSAPGKREKLEGQGYENLAKRLTPIKLVQRAMNGIMELIKNEQDEKAIQKLLYKTALRVIKKAPVPDVIAKAAARTLAARAYKEWQSFKSKIQQDNKPSSQTEQIPPNEQKALDKAPPLMEAGTTDALKKEITNTFAFKDPWSQSPGDTTFSESES